MARRALRPAGDAPRLRVGLPGDGDVHGKIVTAILHERGLGPGGIPAVAHPVAAARVLHEHPGFDPLLRRGGVAALGFQIEVFHPNLPVRESPRPIARPGHAASPVGDREPAALHRMVAPETEVRLVGQHAGRRREIGEIGEKPRRAERRGEAAVGGGRDETVESVEVIHPEDIPIGWVGAKGREVALPGDALHRRHAAGARERPDIARDVIAEDIRAREALEARAAIDHAADDGVALEV